MPKTPRVVLNGRKLTWKYPYLDTSKGTRTAEFEPIGGDAVIQVLGEESRSLSLSGGAFYEDANFIESLDRGEVVELIHYRGSGEVVALETSTTRSDGDGWGGKPDHPDERVFRYSIELAEAFPGSFTFRVGRQELETGLSR